MKTFSLFLCFLAMPLIVLSQDAGKEIVIGATNMNVLYRGVDNPVAQFAGKSEGTIDKITATETLEITADLNSFLWDLNFKVIGFKFVYHKGGFVNELAGTGDKLTDQMKTVINGLNPGDKFGFEDIKAVGPDGRARMMNTIVLQIQ